LPAYRPFRSWDDTYLSRFQAERSAMIDPKPGLGLPLVNHLVQHRVLDLGPGMSCDVPAADGDFQGLA
jgi:hypothetical protein